MIIVQLMDGLGNQLFQYATARRISEKQQVDLKFDIDRFDNDELRDYSLFPFNITGTAAQPKEIRQIKKMDMFLKFLPGFRELIPVRFRRILRAPLFKSPNPHEILAAGKEHYLQGSWGHEKLFIDIRSILLQEITLKPEFRTEEYLKIQEKLKKENSISLHIRRGDYAENTFNRSFFGIMPLNYYKEAINVILQKEKNTKFYVFSDDIQWVKNQFDLEGFSFEAIQDYGSFKDYHELTLMASCKHNIIANSTFSWWGAWLNPNPSKTVVAPKKWYKNPEAQFFYENYDFVPTTWIKK